MNIDEISKGFGAVITNVNLMGINDKNVKKKIYEVFLDRRVVCIRGCAPTHEGFANFSRAFGQPKVQLLADYRLDGFPEMSLISNYNRIGGSRPYVRATYWHTDDSYFAQPAKATLLCAQALPSNGGETGFINCHTVLEEMAVKLRRRIDDRRALHKYLSRRNKARVAKRNASEEAATPDVSHPLVRTHPETNQMSLYINPNRIDRIEGIPLDESDELLDEVYAFALQEKFQQRHHWQIGDILMWDNRCTMHRAITNFVVNERREFLRILLKGDTPI